MCVSIWRLHSSVSMTSMVLLVVYRKYITYFPVFVSTSVVDLPFKSTAIYKFFFKLSPTVWRQIHAGSVSPSANAQLQLKLALRSSSISSVSFPLCLPSVLPCPVLQAEPTCRVRTPLHRYAHQRQSLRLCLAALVCSPVPCTGLFLRKATVPN